MSTFANPNIVSSGLSLHLDASNLRSYPGSGATLFDASGNGRNFTGNASFIQSQRIVSGATWTCSSTLVNNVLNTDVFSLFFYIRFNTTGGNSTSTTGAWNKVFEHAPAGTDRSPGIWRFPDNRRIHWRYDSGNTGIDFGPTGGGDDFATNTWYYIGQTKNGAAVKAYVNGVEVNSGDVANPKTSGNADINLLPSYPADICSLNEITIYNRVLSVDEVNLNFNATRRRYSI